MAYEIPSKTEGWDKDGDFDATFYFHLVNLGWKVEGEDLWKEMEKRRYGKKPYVVSE